MREKLKFPSLVLMNPEANSPMMALLHIFGKPCEIILGLTILQIKGFVASRFGWTGRYRADKTCITYPSVYKVLEA
jgi:hypothetical protein